MYNENIQVIEKGNEIIVEYIPNSEDLETDFYGSDQIIANWNHTVKKTSIWTFIIYRWLVDNWLWLALAGGVSFLLNQNIYGRVTGWLGGFLGGMINTALNFSVYEHNGQNITIVNLLIWGYLTHFVLFHLVRIPYLLREQWKNDKLIAKKELLRRIQDYRKAKVEAFQNNQRLHEWANRLLTRQVLVNKETKQILANFYPVVELAELNLSPKLFSTLKASFTVKKETNLLTENQENSNESIYE